VRVPPAPSPGDEPVWHQYVVRAERRDALAASLRESGIGCGIYYPVPIHLQACFADLGLGEGAFPETERASREVLALPIYPGLTDGEVDRVCEAVAGFYGVRP
ncbi:MAG TPA: DegT/DnrJ/EryC1/StrS family aminotransferase, partial [Candidatus Saccharimonadales bacterium]|nr:DegT/DnrJ/EryC1/StrS family aminotransferase [Candidatus Saccharimonadales bacterium]